MQGHLENSTSDRNASSIPEGTNWIKAEVSQLTLKLKELKWISASKILLWQNMKKDKNKLRLHY